jgi:hypothetical protein
MLLIGSLAVMAAAAPAHAVSLLNGATLSFGGLQLTVSNCQLTLASVLQSGCGAYAMEITDDGGVGANLRITGAGGGALFSASNSSGSNKIYDVAFDMTLVPLFPNTTVTSVSGAISATATGSQFVGLASMGEVIRNSSNVQVGSFSVNGFSPTSNSTSVSLGSPLTSFSVHKDIGMTVLNGAGTLTLNYATQGFLPAPEPMSIGLFGVGLAGLALLRRRLRPRP